MSNRDNDEVEVGDIDYSHRRRVGGTRTGFQTGGIFDDIGGAVGGAYDAVAGAADWAAGSTDEAVARTFDDEPGGGIIDGFLSATPFLSQAQTTTERQIEQGIIDEPEGWTDPDAQNQQQQGTNNEFQRSGTPTTDGQNNNQNNEQNGSMFQGESGKTLAMVGGAIVVGGYALTKVGGSDSERGQVDLHRETPRERGNGARSNRGNSSRGNR